ncbi:endonuclease domain-containing protein [Streptomyces sp. NPDC007088]|uniref:endonuclease domain-containing protein n=1 Tax=Streptomyces sp. NPDC007088 TaxID=3364773 RepID=UPI0036851DCB
MSALHQVRRRPDAGGPWTTRYPPPTGHPLTAHRRTAGSAQPGTAAGAGPPGAARYGRGFPVPRGRERRLPREEAALTFRAAASLPGQPGGEPARVPRGTEPGRPSTPRTRPSPTGIRASDRLPAGARRIRPSRPAVHVDHRHKTGRVRDVPCFNCNSAIGTLGDDPDTVRRAAAYLEGNPWKPTLVAPGVYQLPS